MRENYWKDESVWVCTSHMPSAKIPSRLEECWYCGRASVRPSSSNRPKRPPPSPEELIRMKKRTTVLDWDLCAWRNCDQDNGEVAPSRQSLGTSRSKYCSLACKNKNARYNYTSKNK